jgi:hypothetical protein
MRRGREEIFWHMSRHEGSTLRPRVRRHGSEKNNLVNIQYELGMAMPFIVNRICTSRKPVLRTEIVEKTKMKQLW